jgi:hypothetical protein
MHFEFKLENVSKGSPVRLSRKTTIQRLRKTVQAGKRQVLLKAALDSPLYCQVIMEEVEPALSRM